MSTTFFCEDDIETLARRRNTIRGARKLAKLMGTSHQTVGRWFEAAKAKLPDAHPIGYEIWEDGDGRKCMIEGAWWSYVLKQRQRSHAPEKSRRRRKSIRGAEA